MADETLKFEGDASGASEAIDSITAKIRQMEAAGYRLLKMTHDQATEARALNATLRFQGEAYEEVLVKLSRLSSSANFSQNIQRTVNEQARHLDIIRAQNQAIRDQEAAIRRQDAVMREAIRAEASGRRQQLAFFRDLRREQELEIRDTRERLKLFSNFGANVFSGNPFGAAMSRSSISAGIGRSLGLEAGGFTIASATASTGIGLTVAAAFAAGHALKEGTEAAYEFEPLMVRVGVASKGTASEVSRLREQVVELSGAFGVDRVEEARAAYVAFRSGVVDAAHGQETLSVANKLALATGDGVENSMTAITTVMRAYSKEGLSAGEAAAVLFKLNKDVGVSAADAAGNIGREVANARELGITFRESVALISALKEKGETSEQAFTGAAQFFNSLLANEEIFRKFGMTGREFIRDSGGLVNAFKRLRDVLAGGDTDTGKVLGNVKGVRGALSGIISDPDLLLQKLKELEKAAPEFGTAIDKSAQVAEQRIVSLTTRLKNLFETLGTRLNQAGGSLFPDAFIPGPKLEIPKRVTIEGRKEQDLNEATDTAHKYAIALRDALLAQDKLAHPATGIHFGTELENFKRDQAEKREARRAAADQAKFDEHEVELRKREDLRQTDQEASDRAREAQAQKLRDIHDVSDASREAHRKELEEKHELSAVDHDRASFNKEIAGIQRELIDAADKKATPQKQLQDQLAAVFRFRQVTRANLGSALGANDLTGAKSEFGNLEASLQEEIKVREKFASLDPNSPQKIQQLQQQRIALRHREFELEKALRKQDRDEKDNERIKEQAFRDAEHQLTIQFQKEEHEQSLAARKKEFEEGHEARVREFAERRREHDAEVAGAKEALNLETEFEANYKKRLTLEQDLASGVGKTTEKLNEQLATYRELTLEAAKMLGLNTKELEKIPVPKVQAISDATKKLEEDAAVDAVKVREQEKAAQNPNEHYKRFLEQPYPTKEMQQSVQSEDRSFLQQVATDKAKDFLMEKYGPGNFFGLDSEVINAAVAYYRTHDPAIIKKYPYNNIAGLASEIPVGYSEGGDVQGSGSGDVVPAMLEPGEFVINKAYAEKVRAGKISVAEAMVQQSKEESSPYIANTEKAVRNPQNSDRRQTIGQFMREWDYQKSRPGYIAKLEAEARAQSENYAANYKKGPTMDLGGYVDPSKAPGLEAEARAYGASRPVVHTGPYQGVASYGGSVSPTSKSQVVRVNSGGVNVTIHVNGAGSPAATAKHVFAEFRRRIRRGDIEIERKD